MTKVIERLKEIELKLKNHIAYGCKDDEDRINFERLKAEKQGLFLGLEEGRKEVFERIKKFKVVNKSKGEERGYHISIGRKDLEKLKQEILKKDE